MAASSLSALRRALIPRLPDDHKGVFGHALIVGGSRGMLGAPLLSTRAALRSGVGLVTLALPRSLQDAAAAAVPEALTLGLPESPTGSIESSALAVIQEALQSRRFTVVAIGPGLSLAPGAQEFVFSLLEGVSLPAVVDADALTALAGAAKRARELFAGRRSLPCVFTPHAGEMARCLGLHRTAAVLKNRGASAMKLAQDWRGVCLLKGRNSVVSDGRESAINATGGPSLSKGGSGDVLTGLLAGLWAQMIASGRFKGSPMETAFGAAALGAHLHGMAGDLAGRALGAWSTTASDVIDNLPQAFKKLSR